MDTGDTYTIYCDDQAVAGTYRELAAAQMQVAGLEWDEKARIRRTPVQFNRIEVRHVYRIVQS